MNHNGISPQRQLLACIIYWALFKFPEVNPNYREKCRGPVKQRHVGILLNHNGQELIISKGAFLSLNDGYIFVINDLHSIQNRDVLKSLELR